MRAAGAWVFSGGLHPASTATVVRDRDGDALLTDGPFTEGKEHLGGFTIINAPDLDAALAWGARMARASTPAGRGAGSGRMSGRPIERIFREEYGRAVAVLVRVFGDIDLAEEAVQDAFATAVQRWPVDGRAAQPGRLDHHDRPQPGDRPAAP